MLEMRKLVCIVFLVLLSVSSLGFALSSTIEATRVIPVPYEVTIPNNPTQRGFDIYVEKATITVTDRFATDQARRQALEQAVQDFRTNPATATNPAIRTGTQKRQEQEVQSIENALVRVEYMQAGGAWAPALCDGASPEIRTILSIPTTFILPDGTEVTGPTTITRPDGTQRIVGINYYAHCAIPESFYDKKCVDFRFTSIPDNTARYTTSQGFSRLCDDEISANTALTDALKSEFDTSRLNHLDPKYWTYVLFTAILGVLLATLYFSGKSPLALLDIAQPRLPSPKKGLTAGGQILAPYGYTELKKVTRDQMKLLAGRGGTFEREIPLLLAGLSGAQQREIQTTVSAMKVTLADKMAGDHDEIKNFGRTLAALYVRLTGGSLERIRPLLAKHINAYNESDHRLLGEVLTEMENRGSERDRFLVRILGQYITGNLTYKQLGVLTGDSATGSNTLVRGYQTLLTKTIGGGRFSTLSYVIPSIPDSIVRSGRVGARMAGAAAGVIIPNAAFRAADRAKERTDARVAHAELTGTPLTRLERLRGWTVNLLHGVATSPLLTSAHPDHMIVGGKAPLLDQMAHYFVRLENEAYKDLMKSTLRALYERYGVTLDIEQLLAGARYNRDLRGLILIDLLHEAGVTGARLQEIHAVDAQVRRIFANQNPDVRERNQQRLSELLELARAQGARVGHVQTALDGLTEISDRVSRNDTASHLALFELERHLQNNHAEYDIHGRWVSGVYAVGKDRLSAQEQFEALVFRRMIHDLERGLHSEEAGLEHALVGAYQDLENRLLTVVPLHELARKGGKLDEHDPRVIELANKIASSTFGDVYTGEELIQIQRRTLNYLTNHFLTDEGRAHLQRVIEEESGKKVVHLDENVLFANIGSLSKVFYGAHEITENRGIKGTINAAVDPKTGKVLWPGEEGEIGPNQDHFHLDAKRFWTLEPKDAESFAIAQWVKNRFARSHISAYNVDVEREQDALYGLPEHHIGETTRTLLRRALIQEEIEREVKTTSNKKGQEIVDAELRRRVEERLAALSPHDQEELEGRVADHLHRNTKLALRMRSEAEYEVVMERSPEARRAWVRMELERDVTNFLNSMTPETYGITHNRVRDLATQVSALLADAIHKDEVGRGLRTRDDHSGTVEELRHYDHTNSQDRRHLERLLRDPEQHAMFETYLAKGVSYADVTTGRQVWVMLHEGPMVPYVKGMSLSDYDRILGGYVAIRDPSNGRHRRFEPNNVEINFTPYSFKDIKKNSDELHRLTNLRRDALSPAEHELHTTLLLRERNPGAPGGPLAAHEQEELARLNRLMDHHLSDVDRAQFHELSENLRLQIGWNTLLGASQTHRYAESDSRRVRQDEVLGNHWTWESFMQEAANWKQHAPDDFNREAVYNGALWRYANQTNDWRGFWQHSAIEVVPKRDATPFAPQSVRFFWNSPFNFLGIEALPVGSADDVFSRRLGGITRAVRNAFLGLGDVVSRVSLAAAGPVFDTSYSISPLTEHYRQQSWGIAHDILRMRNWDEFLSDVPEAQRSKLRAAYESVALSHGAYHQVWDYVIDRNPWRQSTSFGAHQAWGSFFHFGPAIPFGIRSNLRTLYTGAGHTQLEGDNVFSQGFNRFISGAEWALFNVQHGWQMRAARLAIMPFALAARAFQIAMQGNPSRWDLTESPMKPWNYTPQRIREAFSSISPFTSFEKFDLPFGLKVPAFMSKLSDRFQGKTIDISEPWGNSLVRTHLAGRDFGGGLKVTPQDISFIRTGVYAVARTGEANPGVSYYDYRHTLQLDPAAAQFLAYRDNGISAYFRGRSSVKDQALIGTIKREVSGEALAIKREEELRSFGWFGNPLFSLFNPAMIVWHGLPGFPQVSLKEFFTWRKNVKTGEKTFDLKDTAKSVWKAVAPLPVTFGGPRVFGWESEAGLFPGTMWRPFREVYAVSCASCGHGGYMGTVCRKCSRIIFQAATYKNTLSNKPAIWGRAVSAWERW